MEKQSLFFLAILIITGLAACSRVPPASPELSQLYVILSEMDLMDKTKPLKIDRYYEEGDIIHFLPDQDNSKQGFLFFIEKNSGNTLYYFEENGDLSDGMGFDYYETQAWEYPLVAQTLVHEGRGGYLFLLEFNGNNAEYNIIEYQPRTGEGESGGSLYHLVRDKDLREKIHTDYGIVNGWDQANLLLTGASISPADNQLYVCVSYPNGGDRQYFEYNYSIDFLNGLSDGRQTRTGGTLQIPQDYNNCTYFYNAASELGVISAFDGTDYYILSWDNDFIPIEERPLQEQYQHYLSTNTFLTDRWKNFNLYSMQGSEQHKVEDCRLTFEYEIIADETAHTIFSFFNFFDQDGGDAYYIFYLFSQPTAQLNKL